MGMSPTDVYRAPVRSADSISSLVIDLQAARFAITAGSMLGSAVWSESVSHFSRVKTTGGAASVAVVALGVQQLGPGTCVSEMFSSGNTSSTADSDEHDNLTALSRWGRRILLHPSS
jgi:hypothetical protein